GENPLRNTVRAVRINARLEAEIWIVDVVVGDDLRRIDRKHRGAPGENLAHAVAFDRLYLVFGLAGSVVETGPDAEHSLSSKAGGGETEPQTRSEIALGALVEVRGLGVAEEARGCIHDHG